MIEYEENVRAGGAYALERFFGFFADGETLRESLRNVVGRLNKQRVPYAISGGSALAVHGAFCGTRDFQVLTNVPAAFRATEVEGIRFLNLEALIELKLASGMTAITRLKDLGDVIELIKVRNLGEDFADKLNPYVREKYLELARAVKNEVNPFE